MPPFIDSFTLPVLEPSRLVLVPLNCFYCGANSEEDVYEWRICHLFGIFHCSEHKWCADRDCKKYLRQNNFVRKWDAQEHPILGPFLTALGTNIPVLRTSGIIEQGWHIPYIDETPLIRKSRTTQEWGLRLSNGDLDKFVSLNQFRDVRITPFISNSIQEQLDTVISCLENGIY